MIIVQLYTQLEHVAKGKPGKNSGVNRIRTHELPKLKIGYDKV